jgi:hypothetical protein
VLDFDKCAGYKNKETCSVLISGAGYKRIVLDPISCVRNKKEVVLHTSQTANKEMCSILISCAGYKKESCSTQAKLQIKSCARF